MDIRKLIRLHELIEIEKTGNPATLATRLAFSERNLHYYLSFMKKEMNAPIVYDAKNETYLYEKECHLCFKNKEKPNLL